MPSAIYLALEKLLHALPGIHLTIRQRIRKMHRTTYGVPLDLTAGEVAQCKYSPSEEERISYYLGAIGTRKLILDSGNPDFQPGGELPRLAIATRGSLSRAARNRSIKDGYTLPVINILNLLPPACGSSRFLYRYGDHWQKSRYEGAIAKARQCDDPSVTLLNLNPNRHWRFVKDVAPLDIPYRQKNNMALWRGANTGQNKPRARRGDLVSKYFDHKDRFDVGFSFVSNPGDAMARFVKGRMSLQEQLAYKVLLCLEGNDVASGLKWMLCSNSVVMMPAPMTCSWIMEDRLEPFVHYIPLADDFSDAQERFDWAMGHEAECVQIAENATQYMRRFQDPRREIMIECEVMRRYLDHIEFS